MTKIVKLTESDLNNLVKKVIEEQAAVAAVAPQPAAQQAPLPLCSEFSKNFGTYGNSDLSEFYAKFESNGNMVLYKDVMNGTAKQITYRSSQGKSYTVKEGEPFCKCCAS
jgi:hypothetical protein